LAAKDMYADLEKIEARGKRKKEKSKGFFSSLGNKDEPEPDESQSPESEEISKPTPEPTVSAKEPMFSKREETHPTAPKADQPIPKTQETHRAAPPITHQTGPAKPAARPPEPTPQPESSWKPLTGGKLNKAEEDLLAYKKWLNKGYKSGVLTKEQCTVMVRGKEIELGLRPPE
jgi:hypothetical protein